MAGAPYTVWCPRARIFRRAGAPSTSLVVSTSAYLWLASVAPESASAFCCRPGYRDHPGQPRGDDGMAQGHRVYFLGTLTRNPEVRYAPNGVAVARYGVAVPTRIRQGDTWHADVCCIDVVAFGHQAETMGASL